MRVADTLTQILENPVVETSLDRSRSIDDTIEDVKTKWQVNLEERNPAPAYIEGLEGEPIYTGTDFDLLTFLNALCDRKAVINLPDYDIIAPRKLHVDQRHITESDRHGQLLGLRANKKVHSFSALIKDYQVVETTPDGEKVGAPRSFALVDYNGRWNRGWENMEFRPNREENEFLTEKRLWSDDGITFENFVHPNLANAFYGSRFISTKALASRIEDEARHYRALAKELRREGVRLGGVRPYRPGALVDNWNVEKVRVENLEAILMLPEMQGDYPIVGMDKGGEIREYERMPRSRSGREKVLRFSERRARDLSYREGPQITASVRAVELAYFLDGFRHGKRKPGNELQPGWDIPEWDRSYKTGPRARIYWNGLRLTDDVVLAYRIHKTTVTKSI